MAPGPDLAAGLALGGEDVLAFFLSLAGFLAEVLGDDGFAAGFIFADENLLVETIYPQKESFESR